jgi:hypothetical protein
MKTNAGTKIEIETKTETETSVEAAPAAAEPVPFFSRQLGRPALVVRTGVRAGAMEEQSKRP